MKIICIGRNYADHANEMHSTVPTEPVIFMKPDTALLRNNDDFYIPEFSKEIHYELEIVVRIDKVGKYIAKEFSHRYYNEIGLGIDFTARDLQKEFKEKGLPWEKAKSFDHSAAISPSFINKKNLDLQNIDFQLVKNREIVQKGNSKNMLFSIDEIISHVSKFFTLKIGDLIFTGTPAGVGKINEGDRLEAFLNQQKLLDINIK